MRLFVWTRLAIAAIVVSWLAVTAARAGGILVLKHDELTRRLRTEIPSGAITYQRGDAPRVIIRGTVRRYGFSWPFNLVAYFSRADGRVRVTAESLSVNGRDRADKLAEVDAKLAKLVDEETKADRVEVHRAGKVVFDQLLD